MKIYQQTSLNKHQKILLYVLRELQAIEYTPLTLDKMAEYTGMNKNGVSKVIRELEVMKHVSIKTGEGTASNQYKLKV